MCALCILNSRDRGFHGVFRRVSSPRFVFPCFVGSFCILFCILDCVVLIHIVYLYMYVVKCLGNRLVTNAFTSIVYFLHLYPACDIALLLLYCHAWPTLRARLAFGIYT